MYEGRYNVNGSQGVDNYYIRRLPIHLEMAERRPIERGDIVSALSLVLIFMSIMAGRELGSFYASYDELESLKVLFRVSEEDMSVYLRDVLTGGAPDLGFGLAITLPAVDDETKLVTETPDYARRWIISVTLSAVAVRQPSVSDVELELLVEDESFIQETFTFPKEKVSYLGLVDRRVELRVGDTQPLRSTIIEAASRYSGEVKMEVRGRVRAHLWFLETWLPFSTIRYPLVEAPHVLYSSSEWRGLDGATVSRVETGQPVMASVSFRNPTRVHSLKENVTCTIHRSGLPVASVTKMVNVAPDSEAVYVFQYTPDEPGEYDYILTLDDMLLNSDDPSPKLEAQ